MRVLAIDPATRQCDRGLAVVADGALLWTGHSLEDAAVETPWDFIAVEAQWFDKTADRDVQRILKLARYAGRLQERARAVWPAACPIVVPVAAWKSALFGPAFANAPKKVFSANLAQLPALRHLTNHNLLDAGGIALACCRLGPAVLQQWIET